MINQANQQSEKRQFPRVPEKIAMDLHTDHLGIKAESINISSNGVYCIVAMPMEFMTRVKILLALPDTADSDRVNCIECQGVVVRVEPLEQGHTDSNSYRIAIYFDEIGEKEQLKLTTFIEKRLKQE